MQALTTNSSEFQKVLSKIVAKTWLDEDLKSQFLSNTNAVLQENGLTLPSGVEFSVNDNTLVGTLTSKVSDEEGNVVYEIPLPHKPEGLANQPIQSWANGNNSDSTVFDFEESACKICS